MLSEEGLFIYSSQLDVVHNKQAVYVCSSHATANLMLMGVDQKIVELWKEPVVHISWSLLLSWYICWQSSIAT